MREIMWPLAFWTGLTSLKMMFSSSIHLLANNRIGPVCGVGTSGGVWEKGVGGWIRYKYYVHIYVNGKTRPVESIPGTGGEEG
jgi:hypothetical protein